MKRRYTVLALVAGVHATAGLIVLAQSQNASPAAAGANKGGTATPQGTGAGPFVTQFQSKLLEPDIQHGAVIAAQGTAAGAPACAQCHAYNGVSDASGAFPRIAGQSRSYLAEQLRDFASGARNNAFMTPIAKALSAQDMADVAFMIRHDHVTPREHERADLATQATSGCARESRRDPRHRRQCPEANPEL